jgi:hypothetical protein
MGPRAILDAVVKRKIPSPQWELELRILTVQPIAQCYTNSAITALICNINLSKLKCMKIWRFPKSEQI